MDANNEVRVWGIHTGDDGLFLHNNKIAIGWSAFGDLSKAQASREAFKEQYIKVYPNAKKGAISTCSGILYRFIHEMQVGDYIVFPSKSNRMINIGVIQGEYTYTENVQNSIFDYVNQRNVKWLKHLPRTAFSQGALYEIGSSLTLFMVKNYADEYLAALNGNPEPPPGGDGGITANSIIELTEDFILKELSKNFKGYDFENFVADLLRAMGYKATVSPHGGDRGIDIIAYKDELPPRFLVQVKSCDGDISENTVHALKGALREGDYGLFVTLSGFTKNARDYLDNNPIVKGIDSTELVNLILKYYDKLSEKYRKIIPLEKVYIPVSRSDDE
jgi:restriction system protein